MEELTKRLLEMLPSAKLAIRYEVIKAILPPGIGDGEAQNLLAELASDCGCEFEDLPEHENIIFTRRK